MSTIDDKKIPAETQPLEDTALADVSGGNDGLPRPRILANDGEQEPDEDGTADFRRPKIIP
ncbi:hypothetical protein [Segnochrobactrum spirostomi]|uniref:Uncharacterized protein n=1 Tax=Segnochrobactrum spirostomi TaxID=2608987 RepID=A0A6A7Y3E4_9HYPH|nr:hypothetical protein [Segnochrobactrum spirostomi]MQT13603.1 hypothetical protein [Segnochrobactrum spirostomi]